MFDARAILDDAFRALRGGDVVGAQRLGIAAVDAEAVRPVSDELVIGTAARLVRACGELRCVEAVVGRILDDGADAAQLALPWARP